jgi:hypothetical protein
MHTRKVKNKFISKFTQLPNRKKIEGQFWHMKKSGTKREGVLIVPIFLTVIKEPLLVRINEERDEGTDVVDEVGWGVM